MEAVAAGNSVPVISSSIIYRVMEDVRSRIISLLPPIIEHKVTGEATVLQLFNIGVRGRQTKKVVGCRCRNGIIQKNQNIRVVRRGLQMHEGYLFSKSCYAITHCYAGPIDTLKHHKADIQVVNREMDFGLSLARFDGLSVDDVLQSIETIEKPAKL
jgi:translation initiation factor IF-2